MQEQVSSQEEIAPVSASPLESAAIAGGRVRDRRAWQSLVLGLLVVIVTSVVFSGVLRLQWTNWDDDQYVYGNAAVVQGDYRAAFQTPITNAYNPLPVATFAWEWQQTQSQPSLEARAGLFHLDNLWMHVLCTLLVFILMRMLGLQPVWAALAALLFGLHPMRVESVAWITERKDVLFGMFYVGALIAYVRFLDSRKMLWMALGGILFVLSLLSKIQAVTLPLSMLAIDWYRGRAWNWRILLEKVPFFVGSLTIGVVGIVLLGRGGSLDMAQDFGLLDRILIGLTAYDIYLIKAIVPYENCTYYPYPDQVGWMHYLGAGGALLMGVAAILLRKASREVAFGMAFFTLNIVFLLQIVGAGIGFTADRYSYIPYIGLVFAGCMVAQRATEGRRRWQIAVAGMAILFCAMSAYLTAKYIPVWKNSDTLWSHVIKHHPRKFVFAYVNRGQYLRSQGQRDRALADLNTAVEFWPGHPLGYLNRANVFFDLGQNRAALMDYSKVISLVSPGQSGGQWDAALPEALRNRGTVFSRIGRYDEAIVDYQSAIALNPLDTLAWNNRALTYFSMGNYAQALLDFSEFLKLNAQNAAAFDARGVCHMHLGHYQSALNDFNAAIARSPEQATFYGNRSYAWAVLGDKNAARSDVNRARSMGVQMDPAFIAELR